MQMIEHTGRNEIASTSSTPPSTIFAADRVAAELTGRMVARWDGRRSFSHGHGLSATERLQVERIVEDLDKALAEPVTEPTVRRSAKMLVASMKQSGETFSAADLVASLVIALNGRREAALAEAVRRILAFEAEGFSKTFMPATPEIADLTRRIEQRWALQRESLAAMLRMEEEPAPVKEYQPTAEEMADWRARAARLGRSAVVSSQRTSQGSAAARVVADLEQRRVAKGASHSTADRSS